MLAGLAVLAGLGARIGHLEATISGLCPSSQANPATEVFTPHTAVASQLA